MAKRFFTLLVFLYSFTAYGQESFILKKKKVSTSKLKESCCQQLSEVIKLTPKSLSQIAQLQEQSIELMPCMLEGNFFDAKSKEELESVSKKLTSIQERQKKINALLHEQVADLNSLQK